jgi:hypothetical protein
MSEENAETTTRLVLTSDGTLAGKVVVCSADGKFKLDVGGVEGKDPQDILAFSLQMFRNWMERERE